MNLTVHVRLVRAVLPRMVARGSGHVLVTGSTAGHAPVAGMATYSATKAALGVFARALRLEAAPLGVRVTELVVGRTETDLYRDRLDERGRAALHDGAYVQPHDVARDVDVLPAEPGVTPPALR